MLTRCPKCRTAFRVTPEQLKVRQGRVRCGECQAVFNALDSLIEAVPPYGASPAPAAALPASPAEPEPPPAGLQAAAEEQSPPAAAEPASEEAAMATGNAAGSAPEDAAAATEEPIAPPPEAPPASPAGEPGLEPLLHEEPVKRSWPWAVGAAAALFALAAQAAVLFRTEIAILYPGTKPALAAACDLLGCELSLPRKPDLVGIETSDLHPDAGGRLTLTADLRNRAPFAQEYPHLELSLTDTNDQPLVRRVLPPGEYLPPGTSMPGGFRANSDLAINLAVEAPGVPAVGYRLYLFYP